VRSNSPTYVGYAKGQLHEAAKVPTNRGQGRQALVQKYGYDTKFAMHTIRLLETARDLLRTGELKVRRSDGEWLKAIREGALGSYEEFQGYALELIAHVEGLVADSRLPDKQSGEKASRILLGPTEVSRSPLPNIT